jgi:cytochrome c oxidase subunit 2
MLKNFKIKLSELGAIKCSAIEFFYRQIPIMLLCNRPESFNRNNTLLSCKARKVNFCTSFISGGVFFEPLEQFEISAVTISPYFNFIGFFSSSHMVPTVLGICFFTLLCANFSTQSNFFIINLTIFKLVRNLFSVNVANSAKNQKMFFLFYGVFVFILYHNFCGMAPFTYTTTALIITSFLLSMTVFFFVCIKSVLQNGWFFFDHFLPVGVNLRGARWMVIIEIISFFTRVISLGVRLFANLLSGHILLKVLIGFFLLGLAAINTAGGLLFPALLVYFIVLLLINSLEIFISFLQAYTFVFLAIIYFGETTKLQESTLGYWHNKIVFSRPNAFYNGSFFSMIFFLFNAPMPKQMMFQEAGSHLMEELVAFHNDVMVFLIFIVTAMVYLIFINVYYFYIKKDTPEVQAYINSYNVVHNPALEIIWTLLPSFVLLSIVLPSFVLLYITNGRLDALTPPITIKVIGHQWYWTYEYFDIYGNFSAFDSYLVQSDDLSPGAVRLMETSHRLTIPANTKVRFLITSVDVIHSWAVPGLGVKVDACPGRLNEVTVEAAHTGVYMGQCSEICGTNHAFMPIIVEVVFPEYFSGELVARRSFLSTEEFEVYL